MRIAQIVPALVNKGPVNVAHDLSSELSKLGYYVEVFYFDKEQEMDFPCKTTRISFFKGYDFSAFDIIHSHCLRPDMYVAMHYYNHKQAKPILVSTLHQPLTLNAVRQNRHLFVSLIAHWINRRIHRIFDVNVLLSEEQRKLSISNLNTETIRIVGNGRDIDTSISINIADKPILDSLKSKYKILGSISAINRGKGLEQIIDALPMLPDWVFVCVGDGPSLDDLKKRAKDNYVDDRCLFLGYRKNGIAYYHYFDVFVMTTRSEGFPLAYIEAAANALPVVLSDIPILRCISDERCASFYELDNITDLCAKVNQSYINRAFYSQNILNQYIGQLTARKMAEKYLTIYNELLND
jgi:glycosyltransferase involved in cell wall biosynthesis